MIKAHSLANELDGAIAGLAALDPGQLEAMEDRIRDITAEQIARSRSLLPGLIERHDTLGQLLDVTAANLKVLVSVFNLPSRTAPHLAAGTETR